MLLDKMVEDLNEMSTKSHYLKVCFQNAIEERDMAQIIRYHNLLEQEVEAMVNLSDMIETQAQLN